MKRDIEFIRQALFDIEENAPPLEFYQILESMVNKGYEKSFSFAQLELMESAGLFGLTTKDFGECFAVIGLSNRGYDFLESIRNDVVWKKTKNEIEEKKLPKTIKFIAEVAGTFIGELLKHKND